jgi:hypothetical protein
MSGATCAPHGKTSERPNGPSRDTKAKWPFINKNKRKEKKRGARAPPFSNNGKAKWPFQSRGRVPLLSQKEKKKKKGKGSSDPREKEIGRR